MLPHTIAMILEATPGRLGHSASAMYFYRLNRFVNLFICFHCNSRANIGACPPHLHFSGILQSDTRKTPLPDVWTASEPSVFLLRKLTSSCFFFKQIRWLLPEIFPGRLRGPEARWCRLIYLPFRSTKFIAPSSSDEFIIGLQTHAARK